MGGEEHSSGERAAAGEEVRPMKGQTHGEHCKGGTGGWGGGGVSEWEFV